MKMSKHVHDFWNLVQEVLVCLLTFLIRCSSWNMIEFGINVTNTYQECLRVEMYGYDSRRTNKRVLEEDPCFWLKDVMGQQPSTDSMPRCMVRTTRSRFPSSMYTQPISWEVSLARLNHKRQICSMERGLGHRLTYGPQVRVSQVRSLFWLPH